MSVAEIKNFDFSQRFYYFVSLVNLNGKNDGRKGGPLGAIGVYAGIGIELALYIIIFLLAGRWLDNRWGTEPWLMILGAAIGFAAGFYSMFKTLSGLSGPENRNDTGR